MSLGKQWLSRQKEASRDSEEQDNRRNERGWFGESKNNSPETAEDILEYYNNIEAPQKPDNKYRIIVNWKTKPSRKEEFQAIEEYRGYGELRMKFQDGLERTIPYSSIWWVDVEEIGQ